jgi:hypothetical protein
VEYYHLDALGSVRVVTGADGRNGQLSRIGEDAEGHKMLAPWMTPEQGLADTTLGVTDLRGVRIWRWPDAREDDD